MEMTVSLVRSYGPRRPKTWEKRGERTNDVSNIYGSWVRLEVRIMSQLSSVDMIGEK